MNSNHHDNLKAAVYDIRATARNVAMLNIAISKMLEAGITDEESPLWGTLLMISKAHRRGHSHLLRLLEQYPSIYQLADGAENYVDVMHGFAQILIDDANVALQKEMENERSRPSRSTHREERRGALSAGQNPYKRAKSDVTEYERAKELLINLGNGGDVEPQPQHLSDPPEEVEVNVGAMDQMIECAIPPGTGEQYFQEPQDNEDPDQIVPPSADDSSDK